MQLELKSKLDNMTEYYCDLTRCLDKLSGLTDNIWKHYILIDHTGKKDRCLAIRIPGGTVGCVYYDEQLRITDVNIDTNYIVKTYVPNVNTIMKDKYIGTVIEFNDL